MILDIQGIEVKFPFEPYELQKDYMTKVIQALENQQNAVLESPTGTGKTLCLLTSSIAWLLQQKEKGAAKEKSNLQQQTMDVVSQLKNSKIKQEDVESMLEILNNPLDRNKPTWKSSIIIYTSRTHSQLTQAMRELKNSDYKFVEAVSLGSRDQLCINSEVMKEGKTSTERNTLCQVKVKKKQCKYREGVDKVAKSPIVMHNTVKDIEDLVKLGHQCHTCPYYLSREIAQNADVIFMPYNYLLDMKILKAFKINLNDAIIILDEAHNVEKVCEETASIRISSSEIGTCVNDIGHVMKMLDENDQILGTIDHDENERDFTVEDLAKLQEIVLKVEDAIDKIDQVFSKQGRTFPGGKLFEILQSASIDENSYLMIRKLLDSVIQFLTQSSAGNLFGRKGTGLMKLMEVLETVFDNIPEGSFDGYIKQMQKSYRLHVELEPEQKKRDSNGIWISAGQTKLKGNPKILNYWCFDPGFGMANLLKRQVRSIILTSGTLAPLKPLISELALQVDQRLENPHIIKPSQVMVRIINCGPDKEPLNGSYDNRENIKYIKSLGMTIVGICRIVPNGVLIFFPSYPMMNKFIETWQICGIYKTLYEIKPILLEPRGKEEFLETIKEYYELVTQKKGAIYMAVLRGKVSEGLDFNDHNARAVIICGIPFPPMLDPRVILKKQYLDINRNNINQLQTGQEWYVLEAVRAVNQAIGRVIRHKDDYGAIFLCDRRFHNQKNQLSRWIQSHLAKQTQNDSNFGQIIGEAARFFRNLKESMPEPAIRENSDDNSAKNNVKNDDVKISSLEFVKQQIKLESSNEMYSAAGQKMNADDFAKYVDEMKSKIKTESDGFMGSLNRDISVIDFNSTNGGPSTSSYKTTRSNDSQELENAAKRRRFKMIPNANQMFPDEEIHHRPFIKRSDYDKEVPTVKKDFLAVMREWLPKEEYKLFLSAIVNYDKKEYTIDKFVQKLLKIFRTHTEAIALMRQSKIFVDHGHKAIIDKALEDNFLILD